MKNLPTGRTIAGTVGFAHLGAVGTFPDINPGESASIDCNDFPADMAPVGAIVADFDGPIDQVGLIITGTRIDGAGTPIITLYNGTASIITPSNMPFWAFYEKAP